MAQTKAYDPAKTSEIQHNGRSGTDTEAAQQPEEYEQWLYDNPEALAAVKQGLADSAAGRVVKRSSYAQHAEDEIED